MLFVGKLEVQRGAAVVFPSACTAQFLQPAAPEMDARPPYEQLHRGRMKYDLVTVKVHPRCESILASFVSAGVARNLNPARSDAAALQILP
jgi:hypothetical protein